MNVVWIHVKAKLMFKICDNNKKIQCTNRKINDSRQHVMTLHTSGWVIHDLPPTARNSLVDRHISCCYGTQRLMAVTQGPTQGQFHFTFLQSVSLSVVLIFSSLLRLGILSYVLPRNFQTQMLALDLHTTFCLHPPPRFMRSPIHLFKFNHAKKQKSHLQRVKIRIT